MVLFIFPLLEQQWVAMCVQLSTWSVGRQQVSGTDLCSCLPLHNPCTLLLIPRCLAELPLLHTRPVLETSLRKMPYSYDGLFCVN